MQKRKPGEAWVFTEEVEFIENRECDESSEWPVPRAIQQLGSSQARPACRTNLVTSSSCRLSEDTSQPCLRYRRGASLPPQYSTQERRESDRLRFRKKCKSWALKHTPSALIEKDVLSFTFQKFPKFLGITHSHFIANKQTNKTVTVLKVLCLKMNIPGCPWWSNG